MSLRRAFPGRQKGKRHPILCDLYQTPDHIPIRLPEKFKKCYSGKTADISKYDAMFAVELRLPLMALHYQLANFLGLSIS